MCDRMIALREARYRPTDGFELPLSALTYALNQQNENYDVGNQSCYIADAQSGTS